MLIAERPQRRRRQLLTVPNLCGPNRNRSIVSMFAPEPFHRHLESVGAMRPMASPGSSPCLSVIVPGGRNMRRNNFRSSCGRRTKYGKFPAVTSISLEARGASQLVHAGHTLLHDLKENVVTPYVMVESLGWFYALPIFGKTAVPACISA